MMAYKIKTATKYEFLKTSKADECFRKTEIPLPCGHLSLDLWKNYIYKAAFVHESPAKIPNQLPPHLETEEEQNTEQLILNHIALHYPEIPETPGLLLCGTPFQQAVWKTLLRIPLGETRTYQDVAEKIGKPKATRAVGTAIGQNPIAIIIPCHRVLRKDGQLGGYHWGIKIKQYLLDREQQCQSLPL